MDNPACLVHKQLFIEFQSPLQCATEYYVQVFVIGIQRLNGVQQQSIQEQVVVGGKESGVCEISFFTT